MSARSTLLDEYEPERPADAGWLALRVSADNAAREAIMVPLLNPLTDYLRGTDNTGSMVHVVDLGAGTGANAHWLAPRLPLPQRWTLIDHDAKLLAKANPPVPFTAIAGRLDELESLLETDAQTDGPAAHLITCSALLDVLTTADIEAISAAVAASGAAALFSLNVTGQVRLSPQDPSDAAVGEEFDHHQRRGGRLGPDAPEAAAAALAQRGLSVRRAATTWELTSTDPALLHAWLRGRAEAAIEQRPEFAPEAEGWLRRRRGQLVEGALSAWVEHLDLLALPAGH